MKGIGVKSLILIVLVGVSLLALLTDLSRFESILQQSRWEWVTWLGLFTAMFSGLTYRYLGFGKTSQTAIYKCQTGTPFPGIELLPLKKTTFFVHSFEENKAFEFSRFTRRGLIFLFFFNCVMSLVGEKELSYLANARERTYFGKEQFCPDEKPVVELKEIRPECRLIYRAFQLGYVKDLGTCGKKEEEVPTTLCELRQTDEPYLHFAFRRAKQKRDDVVEIAQTNMPHNIQQQLEKDFERFQPLLKDHVSDLSGDSKSAHFFVTNLPAPPETVLKKYFLSYNPNHCIKEYRGLPNRLPPSKDGLTSSQGVHHAVGHLLFESRYETSVALCKEYNLVWALEDKFCSDLMKNPAQTITKSVMAQQINSVLDRYERKKKVRTHLKFKDPSHFVSINCFTYEGTKTALTNKTMTYRGYKIPVRWLRVSPAPEDLSPESQLLRTTAHLLGPRFNYSHFRSRASFSADEKIKVEPELFDTADFHFSRLGFLADVDVFVGRSWVETRSDLMDVYPYYLHLNHYVEAFRRSYREDRGRFQ